MREITLTKGLVTKVDDCDYAWLSKWKWHAKKGHLTHYACRNSALGEYPKRITISMHKEIMARMRPHSVTEVDHRDRDGLNNCRSNLRQADDVGQGRNQRKKRNNKSGFIGVFYNRSKHSFEASARHFGKRKSLGHFKCPIAAAKARDDFVSQHYGEFAVLNFPLSK